MQEDADFVDEPRLEHQTVKRAAAVEKEIPHVVLTTQFFQCCLQVDMIIADDDGIKSAMLTP